MAPLQCVTAHPVADLLFVGLFPDAASAKQTGFGLAVSMGCAGNLVSSPRIVRTGKSTNPACSPFLWNVIPWSLQFSDFLQQISNSCSETQKDWMRILTSMSLHCQCQDGS